MKRTIPLVTTPSGIYLQLENTPTAGSPTDSTSGSPDAKTPHPRRHRPSCYGSFNKQWRMDADLDHIHRVAVNFRERRNSVVTEWDLLVAHQTAGAPKPDVVVQTSTSSESEMAGAERELSSGQLPSLAAVIFLQIVAIISIAFVLAMAPMSIQLMTTVRTLLIVGGAGLVAMTVIGRSRAGR